jgi:hypothetical protein
VFESAEGLSRDIFARWPRACVVAKDNPIQADLIGIALEWWILPNMVEAPNMLGAHLSLFQTLSISSTLSSCNSVCCVFRIGALGLESSVLISFSQIRFSRKGQYEHCKFEHGHSGCRYQGILGKI